MAIKTTIGTMPEPKKPDEWPKLMVSDDGYALVVWMTGPKKGTVIEPGRSDHKRFQPSNSWNMDAFKPLTGPFTWENE